MQGLMMNFQLTTTSLMRHAERSHPDSEIVTLTNGSRLHRYTMGDAFARVRRLARAMKVLGVGQGDVLGTLAWNDYRHFEVYYALGGIGAVCHTVNPKLFAEQIEFIINHAEDQWLFVDPDFVPILEELAAKLPKVKGYIILSDRADMPDSTLPNLLCYEDLLEPQPAEFDWPELDENSACSLCYTSGTTGNPKGVLYSHRALVLQTYGCCLPANMGLSNQDVVMPIVPMFHVNAWNLPYSAALAGFKLVLPGSKMGDGEALQMLIEGEDVTISAGVPTVWLNLLNYLRDSGKHVARLQRIIVGGAACPLSIMEEFEDTHGVITQAAWGMTELSPLGTYNSLKYPRQHYDDTEYASQRLKAGRPVFGIELKIVDDADQELPWDGVAFGTLKVRGPWVASAYYKLDQSDAHDDNGWFDTGDVATIDAAGSMQITDRTKDVIKSGGEWISSIDLENAAIGHPAVAEAAVIGVPHPRWGERPLLILVLVDGGSVNKQEILQFMDGKVAKWWMPEDVVYLQELPHTATGKIQKVQLRQQMAAARQAEEAQ